MKALGRAKGRRLTLVLLIAIVLTGCGIAASYRPAGKRTIRDYSGGKDYRKTVGVVALLNTSLFRGDQLPFPLMSAFLEHMEATAPEAIFLIPGKTPVADFLWNPPRIANGELDVQALSGMARQAGMNLVVSPMLMDVRVRTRDTGFWFFKDVAYSLQVQAAGVLYDTITGARLALKILTEEVDIDADQAEIVRNGQEIIVDELTEVVGEMGEALGEHLGDAIIESQWMATITEVTDGTCVINSGSNAGIAAGDRFDLLEGSRMLTGLDGQRYVVPGGKIGELIIEQVAEWQSSGSTGSERPPSAGSIAVPAP